MINDDIVSFPFTPDSLTHVLLTTTTSSTIDRAVCQQIFFPVLCLIVGSFVFLSLERKTKKPVSSTTGQTGERKQS